MRIIKKFENFISEEISVVAEPIKSKEITVQKPKEVEEDVKIDLKMATAEDVANKFIELINKSGDDIKKYVEIK